jgi:hypothetical protein
MATLSTRFQVVEVEIDSLNQRLGAARSKAR